MCVITLCTAGFVYKLHIQTVVTAGHTNILMVTDMWFPMSGTDNAKTSTDCKYEEA